MRTVMPHATSVEISVYLRQRVREQIAAGVPANEIARRAGVSKGLISQFLSGSGAGWKLVQGLASYFGRSLGEIEQEAIAYALEHPDEIPGERVEIETPRAPTLGALPGWAKAEAEARRRWPHIPPAAYEGARALSGWSFPEQHQLTAELVRRVADLWLDMQAAPPPDPEQVRREIEEDAKLEKGLEDLKRRRKR
jgi:transcriptional regulator with XRE-family HTH domain